MPSSRSCSSFFIVHVSAPYSGRLSTQALKKEALVEVEMRDVQTLRSLLQAFQACPFLARKSFLLSATYDPRYLKSSTSSMCAPSIEPILGWVGPSFISPSIHVPNRIVKTGSAGFVWHSEETRRCSPSSSSQRGFSPAVHLPSVSLTRCHSAAANYSQAVAPYSWPRASQSTSLWEHFT